MGSFIQQLKIYNILKKKETSKNFYIFKKKKYKKLKKIIIKDI
jgi:hypothetical protein